MGHFFEFQLEHGDRSLLQKQGTHKNIVCIALLILHRKKVFHADELLISVAECEALAADKSVQC